MTLSGWLCTAAFVLSTLVLGIFLKLSKPELIPDLCAKKQASFWICQKKMPIAHAQAGDLALIDGISLKSARRIVAFISAHSSVALNDLESIRGVGPKTLEKIKKYFY